MKKFFVCIFSCCLCTIASAQLKLETKSFRLADLSGKMTKVVLHGQDGLDPAIKTAMLSTWYLSPYESCSKAEFSTLKHSSDYYFIVIDSLEQNIPGINMLYLFKGQKGSAKKYDGLYNVIALPFSGSGQIKARELAVLPVLLTVMQNMVSKMQGKTFNLSSTVKHNIKDVSFRKEQKLVIEEEDLINDVKLQELESKGLVIGGEGSVPACLSRHEENTFIGLCIAPEKLSKGSRYFNLLIDANSWDLFYMKEHTVAKNGDKAGFDYKELSRFLESEQ